jgi:hypothetical protein
MTIKKIIIILVAIIFLSFGYYAISPLFINIKVDEALPESVQNPNQNPDLNNPNKIEEPDEVVIEMSAPVVGSTGHPASGTAKIIKADDKIFLRYENFKTINGPDLYVYLATDLEAQDFISLGRLKATEGNINYEIPADVDITKYQYALVWCKQFGVLFNSANIAQ